MSEIFITIFGYMNECMYVKKQTLYFICMYIYLSLSRQYNDTDFLKIKKLTKQKCLTVMSRTHTRIKKNS